MTTKGDFTDECDVTESRGAGVGKISVPRLPHLD